MTPRWEAIASLPGCNSTCGLVREAHFTRRVVGLSKEGVENMNPLDRISVDPVVCHGQACIKGTRIPAWLIVQFVANGDTVDRVLAAYPSVSREDVQVCLAYAAELAREHDLPVEATP